MTQYKKCRANRPQVRNSLLCAEKRDGRKMEFPRRFETKKQRNHALVRRCRHNKAGNKRAVRDRNLLPAPVRSDTRSGLSKSQVWFHRIVEIMSDCRSEDQSSILCGTAIKIRAANVFL